MELASSIYRNPAFAMFGIGGGILLINAMMTRGYLETASNKEEYEKMEKRVARWYDVGVTLLGAATIFLALGVIAPGENPLQSIRDAFGGKPQLTAQPDFL